MLTCVALSRNRDLCDLSVRRVCVCVFMQQVRSEALLQMERSVGIGTWLLLEVSQESDASKSDGNVMRDENRWNRVII